ncbi:IgGFc-binding protein [Pseudenhygromyxa sp. WMMC2535]|uniref:IgGFc-binding protein n=1 Tax=Pseudenhygromyxa sp. WMMC2535 TaxID=2712867 RepID=UPI001556915B|nr:IgGFc-binding protein [Pseudenhygromyxa sp. WMMC2535]NVB41790.1 IgGFc-binding protein [Pseudenhygromyxa sp. WMMC2535]
MPNALHHASSASALVLLLSAAGCSDDGGRPSDDGADEANDGIDSVDGSDTEAPTSDGANDTQSDGTDDDSSDTSADDGGVKFDIDPTGDFGSAGVACTADLQSVVDDQGQIVEQCGPDEGCYEGACIEACEAAALSQGSIGCEYWAPYSPFYLNHLGDTSFDGSCHALMIANNWGAPANITVNYKGQSYDATAHARIPNGIGDAVTYDPVPADGIPVGEVAILFLSHQPDAQNFGFSLACPVEPVVVGNEAAIATDMGDAFEFISDHPITLYDILPYGGATSFLPSASLLLPRTAWGNNYVLPTPHYATGRTWALAVAREDGTTVTINTNGTIAGGNVPVPAIDTPTDYALDAGQFVQWSATTEIAGSVISSDKPIGVYTGNTYLRVSTADSNGGGQDAAHQQVPHVQALASEYVGLGLPTRRADLTNESVLYRIVGVVDGTTLAYDPAPPAGAPSTLDSGQYVEFETRDFFTVSSQDGDHPFAFTQYMAGVLSGDSLGGCVTPDFGCGLGDEEWITLVPPAQYLNRYAFFVDPTYGVTTLAVVRAKGSNGFAPVEIDCYGPIEGWQSVGLGDTYEVAHVELYRNGVGDCAQSQQDAWSDAPFGIVVWGQDAYASYGYPAGGNLGTINDVIVPVG